MATPRPVRGFCCVRSHSTPLPAWAWPPGSLSRRGSRDVGPWSGRRQTRSSLNTRDCSSTCSAPLSPCLSQAASLLPGPWAPAPCCLEPGHGRVLRADKRYPKVGNWRATGSSSPSLDEARKTSVCPRGQSFWLGLRGTGSHSLTGQTCSFVHVLRRDPRPAYTLFPPPLPRPAAVAALLGDPHVIMNIWSRVPGSFGFPGGVHGCPGPRSPSSPKPARGG